MNIAIIFAGGIGIRMNNIEKPKQFLEIYEKPIIIRTLEKFEHCSDVDGIIIACVKEWIDYLQDLLLRYNFKKVVSVIPGGKTGQLSIYNGLCEARNLYSGKDTIVLIHDGVRPMIDENLITKNIHSVKAHGSAITTCTVKETVLIVNKNNKIENVPTRELSRMAKAPQSFYLKDIIEVHEMALKEGCNDFIDSCSIMNYYGKETYLVDGPSENIKVTTPDDFYMLRAMLESQENKQFIF